MYFFDVCVPLARVYGVSSADTVNVAVATASHDTNLETERCTLPVFHSSGCIFQRIISRITTTLELLYGWASCGLGRGIMPISFSESTILETVGNMVRSYLMHMNA